MGRQIHVFGEFKSTKGMVPLSSGCQKCIPMNLKYQKWSDQAVPYIKRKRRPSSFHRAQLQHDWSTFTFPNSPEYISGKLNFRHFLGPKGDFHISHSLAEMYLDEFGNVKVLRSSCNWALWKEEGLFFLLM